MTTPLQAALTAAAALEDLGLEDRFRRLDSLDAADLRAIVYHLASGYPVLVREALEALAAYRLASQREEQA